MSTSMPTALQGGGNTLPAESMGASVTHRPAIFVAEPADAAPQPKQRSEQVKQAFEQVKAAVAPLAQNLQFSMDEESGKTVVRVVDTTTQTVIRQIPSEEILQIAKELDRVQGMLLRSKA